jgi:rhamnopyranosyl-N-acetylglucosaminyl-diphospho-decaprenol beta-1,3/1,4-galactofuranosyltransferase
MPRTVDDPLMSVASVTTAFDCKSVLPRQLEALLRQTRKPQEIIVVDNASTDGTAKMIAERFPQVTVLPMAENLGTGGALAAGLNYAALVKRHDWVWTLDDDSVPNHDTLEALLQGADSATSTEGNAGMVAPLPVHLEAGACYAPLLWRDGFVKPPAELLHQPIWFADLVISSGCLVRRDVVEKIGLPRVDFFIDFVDFEYCLRARSHGYKIAVITGAKLAHQIGNSRKVHLPGYSRLWLEQAPFREYYMSRNLAYAAWWLYPSNATKRFVAGYLARHAGGVLLFNSNKLACLKKMVQGFWDGRRASLGIRFRPRNA